MNISAPAGDYQPDMEWLQKAMDMPRFDVPFASEGFIGANWADIKEYA